MNLLKFLNQNTVLNKLNLEFINNSFVVGS
jgi:hypothetical protein